MFTCAYDKSSLSIGRVKTWDMISQLEYLSILKSDKNYEEDAKMHFNCFDIASFEYNEIIH